MDKLPIDLIYKIYEYNHQIKYHKVMNELLFFRINTCLCVTLKMAQSMYYCKDCILHPCVNINNINPSSSKLLNLINYNKLN